jgi:CRISPR/Cas system-associated exonuclease Cas4 (RecB family)
MLREVRVLENRLTWSKSRGETLDHCARKYWWTYYGSWGGWAHDAAAEAREAYVLKNLHSRWTWVGDTVHRAIERVLRGLGQRGAPAGGLDLRDEAAGANGSREVDLEAVLRTVTDSMRSQYVDSRDGRYRAAPKRIVGLVEHEYAAPVPASEWKEMNRRALDAVTRFLSSETFARIRASDPATWLPFETLDSFDFEGTPVWAALDFARRTEDGGAEVYDWKTGEDRPEANRLQMLCYAMYVEARHGIPATNVVGRLVYVSTGTVAEVRATAEELEAARGTIRASIAEMRRRLATGSAGAPEPSKLAFPMTDDLARCAHCAFRRLCER